MAPSVLQAGDHGAVMLAAGANAYVCEDEGFDTPLSTARDVAAGGRAWAAATTTAAFGYSDMDIDEFWRVIETVDRTALRLGRERAAVKPLVYELALRDEAEVLRFADILAERLHDLDGRAYAEAAGECGSSADLFLYLRCHVVALGREHYEAVRADPSKFPTAAAEAFESLLYAARWAWASVTGRGADEWEHPDAGELRHRERPRSVGVIVRPARRRAGRGGWWT